MATEAWQGGTGRAILNIWDASRKSLWINPYHILIPGQAFRQQRSSHIEMAEKPNARTAEVALDHLEACVHSDHTFDSHPSPPKSLSRTHWQRRWALLKSPNTSGPGPEGSDCDGPVVLPYKNTIC